MDIISSLKHFFYECISCEHRKYYTRIINVRYILLIYNSQFLGYNFLSEILRYFIEGYGLIPMGPNNYSSATIINITSLIWSSSHGRG